MRWIMSGRGFVDYSENEEQIDRYTHRHRGVPIFRKFSILKCKFPLFGALSNQIFLPDPTKTAINLKVSFTQKIESGI